MNLCVENVVRVPVLLAERNSFKNVGLACTYKFVYIHRFWSHNKKWYLSTKVQLVNPENPWSLIFSTMRIWKSYLKLFVLKIFIMFAGCFLQQNKLHSGKKTDQLQPQDSVKKRRLEIHSQPEKVNKKCLKNGTCLWASVLIQFSLNFVPFPDFLWEWLMGTSHCHTLVLFWNITSVQCHCITYKQLIAAYILLRLQISNLW